jgi:hypothetical protein
MSRWIGFALGMAVAAVVVTLSTFWIVGAICPEWQPTVWSCVAQ